MPIPFFALARMHSARSMTSNSSISPMTRSGSAAGKIDLVNHRNDREIVFECQVVVGECLRFDALGRVDDEQRTFACRERSRNLVRKIDVSRRVDEVQP